MTHQVVVEPADRDRDLEAIVQLGRRFWAQLDYRDPYSETQSRRTMRQAFRHGLVAVVRDTQRQAIAGFAAAVLGPLVCADTLAAVEIAYYVDRSYRGHGLKLLSVLEGLARKSGARYLVMVSMQCHEPETADVIYRRRGFVHSESSYRKELTPWEP